MPLLAPPRRLLTALTDLVLPADCAACGDADAGAPVLCRACAAALTAPPTRRWPTPAPPGLPPTWAVTAYAGAARRALVAYKEHGAVRLRDPLAAALASSVLAAAAPAAGGPLAVVPVPSARAAVRHRGVDPVGRLVRRAVARADAGRGRMAMVPALTQARRPRDQAGLSALDRFVNVAGAFTVVPRHRRRLAGVPVLLADDVLTTGATLGEAARALRAGGYHVVGAAVVAATQRRAVADFSPGGRED